MVNAIIREIEQERNYFKNSTIETLYFGGGTPSVLNPEDLDRIIVKLENSFHFSRNDLKEITLEANPDDLNPQYLKRLKEIGIWRISIGIQTLDDNILRFLNRSHNSDQALKALQFAIEAGFDEINLDFIYGIPGRRSHQLIEELAILGNPFIKHISLYALTIEERTVFGNWLKKGRIEEMSEDQVISEYEEMIHYIETLGFEQYEISNFAREEKYALHNTNYWNGELYLGLGPSAHSFDGNDRRINPSNNSIYIKGIHADILNREKENLTLENRFNEYVMTGLRTKWGISENILKEKFPKQFDSIKAILYHQIKMQNIENNEGLFTLSRKGKLLADEIAKDLFVL